MASLKSTANCIGISGRFSLRRDFFGYATNFPITSLRDQIRLLRGPHVHLNLIEVAPEKFTQHDRLLLDWSLTLMRHIYATINIGVGRIERWQIKEEEAAGNEYIDDEDEAKELYSKWAVPNTGIDVFVVITFGAGEAGLSPIRGTCNKDDKGAKGCAICPAQNLSSLAHEVGHYMGLPHSEKPDNLMNPNGGDRLDDTVNLGFVELPQRDLMLSHCSIRGGCPR